MKDEYGERILKIIEFERIFRVKDRETSNKEWMRKKIHWRYFRRDLGLCIPIVLLNYQLWLVRHENSHPSPSV